MEFTGGGAEGGERGAGGIEPLVNKGEVADFPVQIVINGLEGAAEIPGEAAETAGRGAVGVREEETSLGGEDEEGDGFQFVDAITHGFALIAAELEVEVLALAEAAGLEGAQEFALKPDEAGNLGGRAGLLDDGAGGESDKAERGEHGGGFAEGDVGSGPVAARVLVVHAGEVVNNERGAVDDLYRGGRAEGKEVVLAAEASDAESENGPEALPLAEDGVLHGAPEGRGRLTGVEQGGEVGFDDGTVGCKAGRGNRLEVGKGQCGRHRQC